jgi:hypothetical protein
LSDNRFFSDLAKNGQEWAPSGTISDRNRTGISPPSHVHDHWPVGDALEDEIERKIGGQAEARAMGWCDLSRLEDAAAGCAISAEPTRTAWDKPTRVISR